VQDAVSMVRVTYAENIAQLAETALRFLMFFCTFVLCIVISPVGRLQCFLIMFLEEVIEDITNVSVLLR